MEHVELADYTVVHDLETNQSFMQLRGVVVRPVGSWIELLNPNIDVQVERIRLLAERGTGASAVCLDVRLPQEYWTARSH